MTERSSVEAPEEDAANRSLGYAAVAFQPMAHQGSLSRSAHSGEATQRTEGSVAQASSRASSSFRPTYRSSSVVSCTHLWAMPPGPGPTPGDPPDRGEGLSDGDEEGRPGESASASDSSNFTASP